MAVRWGGRLHGGERRKASSVLPPTRAVEIFTSNFNSFLLFDNSHWSFDSYWLFGIRTDPGFVQNPI